MISELIIASSNQGKVREVQMLLYGLPIRVLGLKDIQFDEKLPEETGLTYVENALIKARFVAQKTQKPAVADDSGIEIDSLPNEFGLHSARVFQGTTQERMQFLLNKMKDSKNRSARFRCAIAFVDPTQKDEKTFEGTMEGSIAHEMHGDDGFDYDFVFIAKGQTKTNAELGVEWKNQHSHRAQALEKLKSFLQNE